MLNLQWWLSSVRAQGKISQGIHLKIMESCNWKHISFCTPPMKKWDHYLWQQSSCKVFVARGSTSFECQCSGSTSKPILKVLWAPNAHHGNDTTFLSSDFVRDCRISEIFNDYSLRQKMFWSLWLLHCQLYVSEWCRILPIAPVFCRSRIYETYSLMKFSVWVSSLLMARGQLDKLLRRHVGCCPWWCWMPWFVLEIGTPA